MTIGIERPIIVAPSLLSADFGRLGEEVRALDAAGADWIHIRLRQLCDERGLDPAVEVDGGQNAASAGLAIEAGANAIVAGTAIFGSADCAAAIPAVNMQHGIDT